MPLELYYSAVDRSVTFQLRVRLPRRLLARTAVTAACQELLDAQRLTTASSSAERGDALARGARHPARAHPRARAHGLVLFQRRRALFRAGQERRDGLLRCAAGVAGFPHRRACNTRLDADAGSGRGPGSSPHGQVEGRSSSALPGFLFARRSLAGSIRFWLSPATLSLHPLHTMSGYKSLAGEPGAHSLSSLSLRSDSCELTLVNADIGTDGPRPKETQGIHLHHACLRIKVRAPAPAGFPHLTSERGRASLLIHVCGTRMNRTPRSRCHSSRTCSACGPSLPTTPAASPCALPFLPFR